MDRRNMTDYEKRQLLREMLTREMDVISGKIPDSELTPEERARRAACHPADEEDEYPLDSANKG